jgi:hypothetical protein
VEIAMLAADEFGMVWLGWLYPRILPELPES